MESQLRRLEIPFEIVLFTAIYRFSSSIVVAIVLWHGVLFSYCRKMTYVIIHFPFTFFYAKYVYIRIMLNCPSAHTFYHYYYYYFFVMWRRWRRQNTSAGVFARKWPTLDQNYIKYLQRIHFYVSNRNIKRSVDFLLLRSSKEHFSWAKS